MGSADGRQSTFKRKSPAETQSAMRSVRSRRSTVGLIGREIIHTHAGNAADSKTAGNHQEGLHNSAPCEVQWRLTRSNWGGVKTSTVMGWGSTLLLSANGGFNTSCNYLRNLGSWLKLKHAEFLHIYIFFQNYVELCVQKTVLRLWYKLYITHASLSSTKTRSSLTPCGGVVHNSTKKSIFVES